MVFAFWIAVACSCRVLVRLHDSEPAKDSQIDLRLGKTLVAFGSSDSPDFLQREKSRINAAFCGHAGVGAHVANRIPPGGYVNMVVMEDLDPVNGSTLSGTIAMVEIEDVVDVNFNKETHKSKRKRCEMDAKLNTLNLKARVPLLPDVGQKEGSLSSQQAVEVFKRNLRLCLLLRRCVSRPRTNPVLENALDTLRRVDFVGMESASATLQKLTSNSRECCARCIEEPASLLIHNVLVRMSTQPSDPTVLGNLLLTLRNLTRYRRWKQQTRQPVTRFDRSGTRRELDSRLIELLGEVLLVLSGDLQPTQQQDWILFTITADTLWDLVLLVTSDTGSPSDESWTGTRQRLLDLHDRLFVQSKQQISKPSGNLLTQYLLHACAILTQLASAMQA
ncbi:hypothetical protein P3T76_005006 [Phytophthora citrophthora]|uniref:Wings apart-like protein C-terminal domain-containing protein n=1 Tax=Phytophthora citrophthora TaxID=4793 RepID=A0AAD9LNH8_9STRA|nr:hypothetical protein P3T76_005006 [Phytophthora citrophthora]